MTTASGSVDRGRRGQQWLVALVFLTTLALGVLLLVCPTSMRLSSVHSAGAVKLGPRVSLNAHLQQRRPHSGVGNTASQPSDSSSLAAAPGGTWHWALNVTRPGLEACIKEVSATPFWRDVAQQYHRLPRLGIVITTESQGVRPSGLNHMEAYAFRQRYGFHSSIIEKGDWESLPDGARIDHFFSARWRHLQQRHLGNYQWVLMLDGDVGALNMSQSLDKFLAAPEDVLLHIRGDYEIAAGAVLMRSTPFSYCFLEEWIRKGIVSDVNSDNGDLIDLIMELAEPPMPECKQFRSQSIESYRKLYMQCLREKYDRLLELHHHLPIKVFFPMAGFWRDFHGTKSPPHGNSIFDSLPFINYYHKCAFPGDIFGHGLKHFDDHWPEEYRQAMAKNLTVHETLPGCQPLTLEDELRVAQDCCFTHYPGCTDSAGGNRCHGAHCPKDPNWWHPNCTSVDGMEAPMK